MFIVFPWIVSAVAISFFSVTTISKSANVETLPTHYRASTASDGSIVVKNVPIFGENKRKIFGDEVSYDKKWLSLALARDAELRSEGYKAPMHFGHHGMSDDRERAGHYELTSVKRCRYDGKPTWILFGTLVFKSQDKLERAIAEFPYRSVEISGEKPDEINSLALLSSEAPYFRFPNLENLSFAALPSGGRAFVWRNKFMLDNDADENKPPVAEDEGKSDKAPPAEDEKAGDEGSDEAEVASEESFTAPEDDALGGEVGGLKGAFKMMSAKLDATLALLTQVLQGTKIAQLQPEQNPVPVVAASAQVEGKVAALEAKLASLEKDRDSEAAFGRLSAKLRPYGIPNLDKSLREKLKISVEAAESYAAGVMSVAKREPKPETNDAPAAEPADPACVATYMTQGPARVAEARRLYAMWASAPKFIRDMKPENFIAANLTKVQEK